MSRRGSWPIVLCLLGAFLLAVSAAPAAAAAPDAPTNLTASFSGNVLTLQWTAPAGPLTSFMVEVGSGPGRSDLGSFPGIQQTSVSVPNPPAGSYWIRVRAVNGSEVGPPSNEVAGTVPGGPGPCVTPGAPRNLQATVNGSSVTFTWDPPADGGPVAAYLLIGRIPGLPDIALPAGAGNSHTVNGVPAGTAQTAIRALNTCGAGAFSNEVTVTVGAPGPGPGPSPGPGNRTPDPPPGQRLPLPGYGWAVVQQVAAAFPGDLRNSCREHGGNNNFMFRVVQELRRLDTRWGMNWKRGNTGDLSQDIVDYNFGAGADEGTTNVYIIDIIGGHCGNNPYPNWQDQTAATRNAGTIGRWTLAGRTFDP